MYTQKEFLSSLGRTMLLFCSKKQLTQIIAHYGHLLQNRTEMLSGALSPGQILKRMRKNVDFFVNSTLWLLLRLIGAAVALWLTIYYLHCYPFRYPFSDMDGPFPYLALSVCGLVCACLWLSINGGALLYLFHAGLQPRKGNILLAAAHVLFVAFEFGGNYILCQEWFLSGRFLINRGVLPEQVGDIVNLFFEMIVIFLMAVLFFSLVASVRSNILYFTLSYHSLLLLCMVFFSKRALSCLGSAEEIIYILEKKVGLYVIPLFVLTAVFFLFYFAAKKKFLQHSNENI